MRGKAAGAAGKAGSIPCPHPYEYARIETEGEATFKRVTRKDGKEGIKKVTDNLITLARCGLCRTEIMRSVRARE